MSRPPSDATPTVPVAEVIAIGDEMIGGGRVDTNTAWIASRLTDLGCDVRFHTTVGDRIDDDAASFRLAATRADVVVATGGLGPTADDLTREAIATAMGVGTQLHGPSLDHIESLFKSRGRTMKTSNRRQAMMPTGSQPIFNPQGTAPGVDAVVTGDGGRRCRVFALPGVPAEMKTMFDDHVAPAVAAMTTGAGVVRTHVMKFFGVGESDMEAMLGDMIARDRSPRVGITVSRATISLRIVARAADDDAAAAMIETTRREALKKAGEYHYGDGEHYELPDAVIDALQSTDRRLGVIECGHAGRISDWMASKERPDRYAGAVQIADVDHQFADAGGDDVWPESMPPADTYLRIVGYPSLRTDGGPLPAAEVRITVWTDKDPGIRRTVSLGGHPDIVHSRIAKAALDLTRRYLRRLPC